MPKISIILPNLQGGGAERLHINLAEDWLARGYQVEFVLMQKNGELLPLVCAQATIKNLNVKKTRYLLLPLAKYLWQANADIIIAAMWPLTSLTVLAWLLTFKKGRLFVSDHNQLSVSCQHELKHKQNLTQLANWIKWTYPQATGIIAVSKGVKADIMAFTGFESDKIEVIYNPAAASNLPYLLATTPRELLWGKGYDYHILAVGTLKPIKDYPTLIKAFAQLPVELNCKLIILGEGECRATLTRLIAALNLQTRVELRGFVTYPQPWFNSADLFVLSSYSEGFGNVIVEALEFGVPVVATQCGGPVEILDNGRYGSLVPVGDYDALAKAMQASLLTSHNHADLKQRAQDFSVATISKQYLSYFFRK